MKKILAVLLAVLTIFSCTAMFASAEDVSEPEETTEAPETISRYDICQDPDFMTLVFLEEGNEKATVLLPGDIITTYKTSDLKIKYYADADGYYKGAWVPSDPNNLAFSVSGKESFMETFRSRVTKEAIIRGVNDPEFPMDFTIAYSDENVFLGWVVFGYEASSNTVSVCGLWDKPHKVPTSDDTDDLYYMIDFFYSLRQKIAAPFFKVIKWISNAILFVKMWLYDLIFGAKKA